VKSENEKGYYIVDAINEAINVGVKISFYYSELNGKKKEVLRNDVKLYTVSPFDLIWDGDYYYLTGYCDEREFVRTYRVDQIKKQLELLTEKAVKKPKGYNVSKYTAEVSRMFSTDEAVDVTLLCDNCCMNDV
jgi:predicted DNA-binding transcriptional regulator YafY